MSLLNKINEYIKKENLSASKFSQLVGINDNIVRKIRSKKSFVPSLVALSSFAKYFKMKPEDFINAMDLEKPLLKKYRLDKSKSTDNKIKVYRIKNLLNLQNLADKCGTSRTAIFNIENNKYKKISPKLIKNLIKVFKVKQEDLNI